MLVGSDALETILEYEGETVESRSKTYTWSDGGDWQLVYEVSNEDAFMGMTLTTTDSEYNDAIINSLIALVPQPIPQAYIPVDGTTIGFNRKGELEAIGGGSLPSYSGAEIGKVLGVQQKNTRAPLPEGELAWVDLPEGVPATTSADAGKVLTVNQNGDGVEWVAVSGGGSGGSGSGTTVVVPSSAPNLISSYTSADIQAISNCINNSDNSCVISYMDAYNRGYIYRLIYKTNTYAKWWCPTGNMTLQMGIDTNTHLVNTIKYTNDGGNQGVNAGEIRLETPVDIFYGNNVESGIRWLNSHKQEKLTAGTGITLTQNTISTKLPECPTTTDGTYVLKATVASGAVTYEWVAE